MFCPKCSAYLKEKELVKTRVSYAPGNVPIEYDARCPQCGVEMGRVSWGQLTVNPMLEKSEPEPEKSTAAPRSDNAPACTCPHCGKPLPASL